MAKTITKGYVSGTINGIKINSTIKCNKGNYTNKIGRNVKYLVFHYTGNKKDTARNNALAFKNHDVDVSAHFFVDDTSIYQSVELRDIAWHCGTTKKYYHAECRNQNSIGVEMCCTAGNYKMSAQTIENSAYLGAYLCEMLNIKSSEVDKYCLRHYDVTHKRCPAQMVDDAEEWIAFKTAIKNILKAKEKKTTTKVDSFFPARGYFKKGDTHENIGKVATFLYKNFPAYTSQKALGNYFGNYLYKSVKEFQRRTNLVSNGQVDKRTLAKLEEYGFKY